MQNGREESLNQIDNSTERLMIANLAGNMKNGKTEYFLEIEV
jgi:hypothetical protein